MRAVYDKVALLNSLIAVEKKTLINIRNDVMVLMACRSIWNGGLRRVV